MKIANILTGTRIATLVPLFWLLSQGPSWLALGIFLLAGVTDILDGYLARKLNQASKFGAFFDLLADRLLTLTLVFGLLIAPNTPPIVIPCLILVGRDMLVSGLNEALPGQLNIRVSLLERFKIFFQFAGFAILMMPPLFAAQAGIVWKDWGLIALSVSALLCLATLGDYIGRAVKAFKPNA